VKDWSVLCDSSVAIPSVKFEADPATLQNCVVMVYPEVAFPTFDPNKGFDEFVRKHMLQMNAALKHYVLQQAEVIILPCKVQNFSWNLPTPVDAHGQPWKISQHVGPAPHNLEYYKIFVRPRVEIDDDILLVKKGMGARKKEKKDAKLSSGESSGDDRKLIVSYAPVTLTATISVGNYLISCNIANSYRNSWFLHRRSINSILEGYHLNVVRDVVLSLPPPLKPSTEYELRKAIESGIDVDQQQLLQYYTGLSDFVNNDDDDTYDDGDMDEDPEGDPDELSTVTTAQGFKVEVETPPEVDPDLFG